MSSSFAVVKNKRIKKYQIEDDNGDRVVRPTRDWVEAQELGRLKRGFQDSRLPKTALKYDFADYLSTDSEGNVNRGPDEDGVIEFLQKYVNRFSLDVGHLYLWGTQNSVQKTTMAAVVGREVLIRGFSVRFILMSTLVDLLQDAKFQGKQDEVDALLSVDFLVVDDSFDKKKITMYKSGYQIPFIDTFLRDRLEVRGLPTCFTSNLSIESIGNAFGDHIQSLVERNIPEKRRLLFKHRYTLKDDFDKLF